MHEEHFVTLTTKGLCLTVKVRPGQSRARGLQVVDIGDDKAALEITIAAAPEDGKANAAIIKEIAQILGLKKQDVSIKSGHNARLKIIEVVGNPESLMERLQVVLTVPKKV